ncbi:class B sortase, LPKTxAVK-specific [Streptococcus panodentis]|uniref:SrtB family sortase n=1 Tax=Streptococcus panodentis TaxID=1581472 RepID=A0ABS5AXG9_9STRE|nr:class B sortase, LPKTxAVK-specific [Streptococcus panodentis]MBP2620951.1 SrtB family sortase [Streptococcus panodentis]
METNSKKRADSGKKLLRVLWGLIFVILAAVLLSQHFKHVSSQQAAKPSVRLYPEQTSASSQSEKDYLANRFKPLKAVNADTIAYVYAPGTKLDEPVVQTNDNASYLVKTFEGGRDAYMGTVFMDKDNQKDFSDRLTWLFGHARGSKAGDHRMFNDVNYYDRQDYFDQHKYVVIETPERRLYYEAMGLVIVPEETAFYRTEFKNDEDFTGQLRKIYEESRTKNSAIDIRAEDKYLVLSTCREEDDTIRSNLYLRQIPDTELEEFLAQHGDQLAYAPTR